MAGENQKKVLAADTSAKSSDARRDCKSSTLDGNLKALRASLASEKNWCQGTPRGENKSHCLRGAIFSLKLSATDELAVMRSLVSRLAKLSWRETDNWNVLARFNDASIRKHKEILSLIDSAIAGAA